MCDSYWKAVRAKLCKLKWLHATLVYITYMDAVSKCVPSRELLAYKFSNKVVAYATMAATLITRLVNMSYTHENFKSRHIPTITNSCVLLLEALMDTAIPNFQKHY